MTEGSYYHAEGDYNTKFAFSKSRARIEATYEPIISTTLNTLAPCYGEERDALILGETGIERLTFPLEKEYYLA